MLFGHFGGQGRERGDRDLRELARVLGLRHACYVKWFLQGVKDGFMDLFGSV